MAFLEPLLAVKKIFFFQSCDNDLSFPIEKHSGVRRGDFDDFEDEYYYDDEDEEYSDYQEYFFEKRPTKPKKKFSTEIERFETESEDVESSLSWKSSANLAKDIMGSLAYAGQAVFAPWTLPGQKFSVKGPHPRLRAISGKNEEN